MTYSSRAGNLTARHISSRTPATPELQAGSSPPMSPGVTGIYPSDKRAGWSGSRVLGAMARTKPARSLVFATGAVRYSMGCGYLGHVPPVYYLRGSLAAGRPSWRGRAGRK